MAEKRIVCAGNMEHTHSFNSQEMADALAVRASKSIKTRGWCLMNYEGGAMKEYHKSTSFTRTENALSEHPAFDGYEPGLLDFDAHSNWIAVAFQVGEEKESCWLVMDPFVTTWLRVLYPRATNRRALRILEDIETLEPACPFPLRRYTWRGLMNQTLQRVTCHHCGKRGEPLTLLKVCAGCKLAHYCNRECQKAAYQEHKIVCSPTERLLKLWRHGDPNAAVKDMMAVYVREIGAVPAGHWVDVKMRDV